MRIGHGYDAHKFTSGRGLVLGGVPVPYDKRLAAHSDGDVVIHALCDALLGAAALGDIGKHFPDTADANRNRNSREFLQGVMRMLEDIGLQVSNADITIVAQQPKLAPYIDSMRKIMADDLKVGLHDINVKATTTEGMGFTGRGEGIAAHAVVLLEPGSEMLFEDDMPLD
jgi:2-C-methyl-D-erythritol 2,4-cyclodiphosphate synthase